MTFTLHLTRKADADLGHLPVKIQTQVAQDIQTLTTSPFPSGNRVKKIKGFRFPLYRLRTGDFRVLYRIIGDQITIMRVIDRKILEPTLRRLRLL